MSLYIIWTFSLCVMFTRFSHIRSPYRFISYITHTVFYTLHLLCHWRQICLKVMCDEFVLSCGSGAQTEMGHKAFELLKNIFILTGHTLRNCRSVSMCRWQWLQWFHVATSFSLQSMVSLYFSVIKYSLTSFFQGFPTTSQSCLQQKQLVQVTWVYNFGHEIMNMWSFTYRGNLVSY